MERDVFALARAAEARHWWFRGRRAILASALETWLPPAAERSILEAGCGHGGNLPMLARFGRVSAFEADDVARAVAEARQVGDIRPGRLPDDVPFGGQRFDVIAALDVLEHIADDQASIAALRDRLTPTGRLVVTVPAYPALWSPHDEAAHHIRRYTRRQLLRQLDRANLHVEHVTYFNMLLLPLAVAQIAAMRLGVTGPASGLKVPVGPLNAALGAVFVMERPLVRGPGLPLGLSILAVAATHRP